MTCAQCGFKATDIMGCPNCRSKEYIPAPRDHKYTREIILPQLKDMEDKTEKKIVELIKEHPLWDNWGSHIRGIGPTILAKVISRCDIQKATTLSKFLAHYGWGLRHDGTIQRKVRGQKIDYDPQAQSMAYMLAVSVERQKGKFFEFYTRWKDENISKGLSDGHATSRAFRNMIHLLMSHLWEKWRKADGLPAPEPYPYSILRPPHDPSTKIKPEEMFDK
jgi:hypothetical protein